MQHTKPTQEELDAQINKSIEEIETNPEITPKDPTIEEAEEKTEVVDEKEEVEETEVKEDKEEEEKTKLTKRYQDSSREAQVLYSKNKKMAEAIDKAGEVQITEDDLKKEYQDWDMMTDFEKKIARESLSTKASLNAIKEATKEFKDMDAWNKKTDDFMANPETLVKYPDLEGKEEEFKLFASKSTRMGVDFTDLVSAFLFTETKNKIKNKGSMMPTGTAGAEKGKSSDGKLSVAESRSLRTVDYKKYLDYLKAGKISEDF